MGNSISSTKASVGDMGATPLFRPLSPPLPARFDATERYGAVKYGTVRNVTEIREDRTADVFNPSLSVECG